MARSLVLSCVTRSSARTKHPGRHSSRGRIGSAARNSDSVRNTEQLIAVCWNRQNGISKRRCSPRWAARSSECPRARFVRAGILTNERERLLPVLNANTIDSNLKRVAILPGEHPRVRAPAAAAAGVLDGVQRGDAPGDRRGRGALLPAEHADRSAPISWPARVTPGRRASRRSPKRSTSARPPAASANTSG